MRWICYLLIIIAQQSFANDDFFSSVDVELEERETSENENRLDPFGYRGYLKAIGKIGLEVPDQSFPFDRGERGLNVLRTDAFLEFRGDLSEQLSWQLSAKAELDWIQWRDGEATWRLEKERLEFKDAYIDASYQNGVWLRAGQQVLAWGEAEGLAISDIISPVDSRAPGQEQIEDLREAVPALMLSVPFSGKLVAAITYDAGHNIYADEHEDFYPYIALKGRAEIDYLAPEDLWEYALKWEKRFHGGDASIILGDVNDNSFSVSAISLSDQGASVSLAQERVKVLGGTFSRVVGSWVFRSELAHLWDQPIELSPQYAWGKQNQWRSMLSAEYSGINDLSLYYEVNSIYAPDDAELPEQGELFNQTFEAGHVFRIMHEALNARLTNQLWVLALTTDSTKVFRWDMSYDLSDSWEVASSLVVYENNDSRSALYPFRDNDTVNLSVTFNF
ncbi:hypothetical protein SAMN02745866_03312 [Alteromonadaceae bacterium Bs31]|nr:hypothetical protein SAMN02745866_03312 [Alteromonadaceae bacterium Bs31]